MLHAEEDADDIDIEHPAKALQRIFGDRPDVALDAGVVVEGIDGAETVDGGADIVLDLVLVGDVGFDCEGLGRGGQVPDGGFEISALAVDRDNPRTPFGEQLERGGSDDAGSSGDDGDPAVEPDAIGHGGFPLAGPVRSGFSWFSRVAACLQREDYHTCSQE
ncbi:hypothetical protein ABIF29_003367 [Bradyrhizobium elkanii]|uniref:Uncharacterized protein n=1 Tax=Bradyrhizobium elkanii TaxID=29448 RepID=A0ABV4EZG6_BRAEL